MPIVVCTLSTCPGAIPACSLGYLYIFMALLALVIYRDAYLIFAYVLAHIAHYSMISILAHRKRPILSCSKLLKSQS